MTDKDALQWRVYTYCWFLTNALSASVAKVEPNQFQLIIVWNSIGYRKKKISPRIDCVKQENKQKVNVISELIISKDLNNFYR
jgi:hypothetical protein